MISFKTPFISDATILTQKMHFVYSTSCYTDTPFCLITSNEIVAKNMIKDLKSITQDKVMFLGKREVVIYDYDVESRESSSESRRESKGRNII